MDYINRAAIELLKELIAIPSYSKTEDNTADAIFNFIVDRGLSPQRLGNNIWITIRSFNKAKPTLLLNSHHDTVRPNDGYSRNPFAADEQDGKLYGLGSNDAGASLVSLLAAFLQLEPREDLSFNLVFAATAEEEISGEGGISSIWSDLPKIDCAIVGEPTGMEIAIAEKGLLVLDCVSHGVAGHAARDEGDNAIYKSLKDIEWFRTYEFPKISPTLGQVKMSVTTIAAGQAHNQVPDTCKFTVDCRVTDAYQLEEIVEIIKTHVSCEVSPRSVRLKPSGIERSHPLVVAGEKQGRKLYGSPTTSDQALIPVPSIKMGPGDSARSHMADEYVFVREIEEGIEGYVSLIENLTLQPGN
ncbi:MAG: M20 family metallo-hydrolase [Cyclobacteriaceae bacterium]